MGARTKVIILIVLALVALGLVFYLQNRLQNLAISGLSAPTSVIDPSGAADGRPGQPFEARAC